MMTIESFVPDVIARLQGVIDAFGDATMDVCNEIANVAVEDLSVNAPYDEEENNETPPGEEGHLNESFYAVEAITSLGGIGSTEVKTHEPVKLEYVTEGTSTPITPTTKQALWWPALDHPVALVAGQEPNPFVEETYNELLTKVDGIVQEIFLQVFEQI
jgi:hypothetical protein